MFLFAADVTLALHLAFILFASLGALLALKWRWIAWLQLPAAAWGVYVEASGKVCPLTPIENHFRVLAGKTAYEGDFIGHYLTATIYPDGLTRHIQFALGALVVVLNLAVYLWLWRKLRARAKRSDTRRAEHSH